MMPGPRDALQAAEPEDDGALVLAQDLEAAQQQEQRARVTAQQLRASPSSSGSDRPGGPGAAARRPPVTRRARRRRPARRCPPSSTRRGRAPCPPARAARARDADLADHRPPRRRRSGGAAPRTTSVATSMRNARPTRADAEDRGSATRARRSRGVEQEQRAEDERDEPAGAEHPEGRQEHLGDAAARARAASSARPDVLTRQHLQRRQRRAAGRSRRPRRGRRRPGCVNSTYSPSMPAIMQEVGDVRIGDDVRARAARAASRWSTTRSRRRRRARRQRRASASRPRPRPSRPSALRRAARRGRVATKSTTLELRRLLRRGRDALAHRLLGPLDVPAALLRDRLAKRRGEVLDLLAEGALDVLAAARRPDAPRRCSCRAPWRRRAPASVMNTPAEPAPAPLGAT